MCAAGPRVFGLKARRADVVAIVRRGPTDWCHISRWDVTQSSVELGSWFRGTISPQKCDVSSDGVWFLYSAFKGTSDWGGGTVYEAVSRLPWLAALAAWEAGTTYTRGAHFVDKPGHNELGEPSVGSLEPSDLGIALTPAVQFAVERRNGWTETAESPPRAAGGHWDEARRVVMEKPQPGGKALLQVAGAYAAFRSTPAIHTGATYTISEAGQARPLDDVQWAEWSNDGLLLTADTAGIVSAHTLGDGFMTERQRHDLSTLVPDPQPPPPQANRW